MYITLGLNQVHYAGSYTLYIWQKCFSHHTTNMIGGATVWTNLNYTHLKKVMGNMLELYELIQDLREF